MTDKTTPNMPDDESSNQQDKVPFSTRTLSNRSSKVLVIVSILLAFAASIGGALLLIDIAETSADQQEEVAPADTIEQGPLPAPGQ